MTRPVLILTTILIQQYFSFGQSYESIFGDTSTSWAIAKEIPDAMYTDSIFTATDTSFDGHNYKSVKDLSYDYGFIREDTTLGQVWFYSKDDNTEYLIMDLTLSVGDSFQINTFQGTEFPIVDSVYFMNGKKHIRFNYVLQIWSEQEKLIFIDGIGANAGILFQHQFGGMTLRSYMLCKYKDNQLVYSNTIFGGDCYVLRTGLSDNSINSSWTLFPNPFSNFTLLKIPRNDNQKCTLQIFNSVGQIAFQLDNITADQIIIDGKKIQNGLNFFKVFNNTHIIATGKLIVDK